MFLRWGFATLHLLALGIGLGAVWVRGRSLGGIDEARALARALRADAWWGLAALLWIGTGVPRAFTSLEKGPTYYLHNHFFFAKMGLLALILVLELWPMVGLIRWRIAIARGAKPDTRHARAYARISTLQAFLVVLMVAAATAMARGFGAR